MSDLSIISCHYDQHAEAILAILNHAITHSAALWDDEPRPFSTMQAWFDLRQQHDCPILGAIDLAMPHQLLGFATYSPFRAPAAYRYSAEHSIYVAASGQRRGVGKTLMQALISHARQQGLHTLIGAIDGDNAASCAFHRALGFHYAGSLNQVGIKDGQRRDLAWYQLILNDETR